MTLPLRKIIPLVLLALTFVQASVLLYFGGIDQERDIEIAALRDSANQMTRLQGTIDYLFRKGDVERIQEEIAALGVDPALRSAQVVDDRAKVIASTRRADRGDSLSDLAKSFPQGVPDSLMDRYELLRPQRRSEVWLSEDRNHVIGIYPIELGKRAGELRPYRIGSLVLWRDLQPDKRHASQRLLGEVLPTTLIAVFFALLLWITLHYVILQRVELMVSTANAFADGDYKQRMGLKGRDELAFLANALDGMAAKVDGDIEALRRAEQNTRDSEAKYRRLIESLKRNYFIYVHDTDGIFTYLTPSINNVLGYSQDEFMTHYAEYLTDNPINRDVEANTEAAMRGEKRAPYEVEVWHKEGGRRLLEVTEEPVFDDGNVIAVEGIAHDITDKRIAEERLRLTQFAVDHAADAIFWVGEDACFLEVNEQACRSLGYDCDEILRMRVHDIDPGFPEEIWPPFWQRMIQERTLHMESHHRKKDGQIFPVDLSLSYLEYGGKKYILAVAHDMSERKHTEALMVQSEKMTSVSGLAAGLAHEINSPLGGMLQGLQNIRRRLSAELGRNREVADDAGVDLDRLEDYLERRQINALMDNVLDAGVRASDIINNMLMFSRKTESGTELVVIESLIEKTLKLASVDYDLRKHYDFRQIEIIRDYHPGLPSVRCTAVEIQQALLNILTNAAQALQCREATQQSPQITVRARREVRSVVIEIEDNGCGMDEETLNHALEPFFTTRDIEKATGLGLAVAYYIVHNNHGGEVTLASTLGEGTRVTIALPIEK